MRNIPVREDNRNEGAAASSAAQTQVASPRKRRTNGLKKPLLVLIIAVAIILAIAGTIYHFAKSGVSSQIDSGKYQALFLTNGQVYFGKLKAADDGYYTLKDIFYLQATSTDSDNPQKTAEKTTDDVKLIKLGSEVHGPDDQMVVNRDQVLFFENLKADGKVSSSISEYTKNK